MTGMTREDLIKDVFSDVQRIRNKAYSSVDELLADVTKVAAAVDNAPVKKGGPS